VQLGKIGGDVISGVKLTKVCLPKFVSDHVNKMEAAESIGDHRSGLWRHLATETTSGVILHVSKRPNHVNVVR
jgi:hypothetical protein